MKYSLAKGGCMHFKCPQCGFEFCSGCSQPFYQKGVNFLFFYFSLKFESLLGCGEYIYLSNQCLSPWRLIPASVKVYSIQLYVTKFVSDLWQLCIQGLWFCPLFKLTPTVLLKSKVFNGKLHTNWTYIIKKVI